MLHRKQLSKEIKRRVERLTKNSKAKGFGTLFNTDFSEMAYDLACACPWEQEVTSPFIDNASPELLQGVVQALENIEGMEAASFNRLREQLAADRKRAG